MLLETMDAEKKALAKRLAKELKKHPLLVLEGDHFTNGRKIAYLLGIGETAKAIVMCMVSRQTGVRLLKRLGRELEMRYPGRGIAFAIPITGIGLRWHKLLTRAIVTLNAVQ